MMNTKAFLTIVLVLVSIGSVMGYHQSDSNNFMCRSCECKCRRWRERRRERRMREQENLPSETPEPMMEEETPSFSPGVSPSTSPKVDTPSEPGYPSGYGSCESCSKENLDDVNQYRASMGMKKLAWDDNLAKKARDHSQWMFEKDSLVHSSYGGWENIAYR